MLFVPIGQARLLGDHDTLQVALLNACERWQSGGDVFSSTASTMVLSSILCVVAMQYEIADTAAIEFSRTFYEALTDGLPIETIISDARKSITFHRERSLEWGTPVFFTHAPDGVLLDLVHTLTAPPATRPSETDKRSSVRTTDAQSTRSTCPKPSWRLSACSMPLIESWEQLQNVEELPSRILWVKNQKEMVLISARPFTMDITEVGCFCTSHPKGIFQCISAE